MNCSLKTKHKNTRRDTVFSESHTHSEYRMVQIWLPTENARKIESWGPGITRQGRRRRSWRRVGWFPDIPRRTAAKVVLESWCYTRKGGQRSSRRIAAQFQGIPSSVVLGTNSPDDGGNSIYTSNSKGRWYEWGSVIYTRVAWVTASTGSQLFKSLYEVTDFNCLYHVTVH